MDASLKFVLSPKIKRSSASYSPSHSGPKSARFESALAQRIGSDELDFRDLGERTAGGVAENAHLGPASAPCAVTSPRTGLPHSDRDLFDGADRRVQFQSVYARSLPLNRVASPSEGC